MKIFRQFYKLLTHPLNEKRKLKTIGRIVWWKVNQLFFKIPAIVEMSKNAKLVCYPESSYGSFVVYANFPEYEEMEFIKHTIKNGDTVIDVGANIGAISILSATSGNKTKVYAFEPTVDLFPYIEENINVNKFQSRIFVVQKAVADKNGTLNFVIESSSEINHIATKGSSAHTTQKVACITLDTFVKQKNISHINFLKVDVEGAELFVFKGAKKLLQKNNIDIILFELNKNIELFGYAPKDMLKFLKNNNYFVFKFTENNKLTLVKDLGKVYKTTNLIAVKKDPVIIRRILKYL